MPRTAMAAPAHDEDASSTRVDDLIQRGRSQGHLSLSDLRTAFEQAGLTAAEAAEALAAEATVKGKGSPVKGSSAKASTAGSTARKSRAKKAADAPAES